MIISYSLVVHILLQYPRPAIACKHCTWAGGCLSPKIATYCYTVYSAMTGEAMRFGCADDKQMSSLVSLLPSPNKWCTVGINQTAVCACRVRDDNFDIDRKTKTKHKNPLKITVIKPATNSVPLHSLTTKVMTTTPQKLNNISQTTNAPNITKEGKFGDSWYYSMAGLLTTVSPMTFNESVLYPATASPSIISVVSTIRSVNPHQTEFADARAIQHYSSVDAENRSKNFGMSSRNFEFSNLYLVYFVLMLLYQVFGAWRK